MSETFIFLLAPNELKNEFETWAPNVYLAIHYGVDESSAKFQLMREEELDEALTAFAGDTAVFPDRAGFKTTKISFATETQVLDLVFSEKQLPQYSLEYSRKYEEGLLKNPTVSEPDEVIEDFSVQSEDKIYSLLVNEDEEELGVSNHNSEQEEPHKLYRTKEVVEAQTIKMDYNKKQVTLQLNQQIGSVDVSSIRFNVSGHEAFIPYTKEEGEKTSLLKIDINQLPETYKNKIPTGKSLLSFDVSDTGILLNMDSIVRTESPLACNIKMVSAFAGVASLLILVSFSLIVASSANESANDALTIVDEINSKSTLDNNMNPIYLNNLREDLLSREEVDTDVE